MVDARQPGKRLLPWRDAARAAAAEEEEKAKAGSDSDKAPSSFPLTRKQALAMLHAPTQVGLKKDVYAL
jgi:hypothetical protein